MNAGRAPAFTRRSLPPGAGAAGTPQPVAKRATPPRPSSIGRPDVRRVRTIPAWPFASRSITRPSTATTARSRCRRRSSGCVRRRIAARRSSATRCGSSRPSTSSTGSRIRTATTWRALVFPGDRRASLAVEVDLVAEMAVINPFDFFLEPYAEAVSVRLRRRCCARSWRRICEVQPAGPLSARSFSPRIDRTPQRTIDFLVELNRRAAAGRRLRHPPGAGRADAAKRRSATRQRLVPRLGWLLVQMLRHLGLAARFVSGYLIQLTPDVKSLDGPAGADVDFTDLHAWAEVYLPGAGWVGLDPTSGLLAGEGHIPLAATPDPRRRRAGHRRASTSAEVEFDHEMTRHAHSRRSRASPSRTPTSSGTRSTRSGDRVDAELDGRRRAADDGRRADVRLDRRHGRRGVEHGGAGPDASASWPASCITPAAAIASRRAACCTSGRASGIPASRCRAGRSAATGAATASRSGTIDALDRRRATTTTASAASEAQRFIADAGASGCGSIPSTCMPAYEDAWYYLWKERRLPVNVDPLDSRARRIPRSASGWRASSSRGWARRRLRAAAAARRARANGRRRRWRAGRGSCAREHLFLMPGDSPMGFRLPLDSLPWVARRHDPYLHEADPIAPLDRRCRAVAAADRDAAAAARPAAQSAARSRRAGRA